MDRVELMDQLLPANVPALDLGKPENFALADKLEDAARHLQQANSAQWGMAGGAAVGTVVLAHASVVTLAMMLAGRVKMEELKGLYEQGVALLPAGAGGAALLVKGQWEKADHRRKKALEEVQGALNLLALDSRVAAEYTDRDKVLERLNEVFESQIPTVGPKSHKIRRVATDVAQVAAAKVQIDEAQRQGSELLAQFPQAA